ncbi:MAG: hypothetical protein WC696_01270 [Candidatus Methylopumilus sp.]|jgi:hypothetical protein
MSINNPNKTHPMVLIAALALTIFSILGGTVIAGLIPVAHTGTEIPARDKLLVKPSQQIPAKSGTGNQDKDSEKRHQAKKIASAMMTGSCDNAYLLVGNKDGGKRSPVAHGRSTALTCDMTSFSSSTIRA